MAKTFNHALHNEEVCDFLCAKPEYVDWIITTAFYSALHFVDKKIFPLNDATNDGKKFKIKNFDDYYLMKYPTRARDKHTARLELVKMKEPAIGADYAWLKSACGTARYTNYKFLREEDYIKRAKSHLEAIKKCCTS